MNAAPRLSIGLPVYNGEDYVAESLESLLGQTYEDFELIVSDNASTDGTADICQGYAKQDSRVRYFRQSRNLGCNPNHNFVIAQARGELFKLASDDDLYARDLLKRCIEVLDQCPQYVLAHAWSALIDASGTVTNVVEYPVASDAPRAPDRFRSMLFDGWGDDDGGVIRTKVLQQVKPYDSYHFADRVFMTEVGLHGPFYQVPDWLWFRRQHPQQAGMQRSMRDRCAVLDPRRADRLRHPAVRLYGEYVLGFASAVRRAPLSGPDRRECYQILGRWTASRVLPVAGRTLSRSGLKVGESAQVPSTDISVDALVAGREGRRP